MTTTPRTDALLASFRDIDHDYELRALETLCRELERENAKLRVAAHDAAERIKPLIALGMCSPHEIEAVRILEDAQS